MGMKSQEHPENFEPFLTLIIGPEETNVRVECPEIGVFTTASKSAIAKNLIASMVESRAEAILSKKKKER